MHYVENMFTAEALSMTRDLGRTASTPGYAADVPMGHKADTDTLGLPLASFLEQATAVVYASWDNSSNAADEPRTPEKVPTKTMDEDGGVTALLASIPKREGHTLAGVLVVDGMVVYTLKPEPLQNLVSQVQSSSGDAQAACSFTSDNWNVSSQFVLRSGADNLVENEPRKLFVCDAFTPVDTRGDDISVVRVHSGTMHLRTSQPTDASPSGIQRGVSMFGEPLILKIPQDASMYPLILHRTARVFAFHRSSQRNAPNDSSGDLSKNGLNEMTPDTLARGAKDMNLFLSQFNSSCVHKVRVVLCLAPKNMTKENLTQILTYVDHELVKPSLPNACRSFTRESDLAKVKIIIISDTPGISATENAVKFTSSDKSNTCFQFSSKQYAEVVVESSVEKGIDLEAYLLKPRTWSYDNYLFFVDTEHTLRTENLISIAHCPVLDSFNNSVFAFTAGPVGKVSTIKRYSRVG